jgi:hypothetical protein
VRPEVTEVEGELELRSRLQCLRDLGGDPPQADPNTYSEV